MADTGLQKVVLDGPLHQAVVNRRSANPLVMLDGLVVVAFESRQIGHLQEMLVCETVSPNWLAREMNTGLSLATYASALSPSNHSAAFS